MRTPVAALSIACLASALPALHPAYASSNHADIAVRSDLDHMSIVITQGTGGGCLGGFRFQPAWGGCVRESLDTHTESQSCPNGDGVQFRQRSRIRYSHQNGSVRHGDFGAWSGWGGDCGSGAWPTDPGPAPEPPRVGPDMPQVGATYFVDAWICDSTNVHYAFPAGPSNSSRNTLISTYKAFNYYERCPERLGYRYWIEQWNLAAQAHASQYGVPLHIAYDATFRLPGTGIRSRMLDRARLHGEDLPDIIASMDAECQIVADRSYGAGRITAVYDRAGNGSRCKVVQVH